MAAGSQAGRVALRAQAVQLVSRLPGRARGTGNPASFPALRLSRRQTRKYSYMTENASRASDGTRDVEMGYSHTLAREILSISPPRRQA